MNGMGSVHGPRGKPGKDTQDDFKKRTLPVFRGQKEESGGADLTTSGLVGDCFALMQDAEPSRVCFGKPFTTHLIPSFSGQHLIASKS